MGIFKVDILYLINSYIILFRALAKNSSLFSPLQSMQCLRITKEFPSDEMIRNCFLEIL